MEWKRLIKACIFDLDGVIVDTAKYHFEAWKKLGAQYGFHFDEAFNENLKGVSRVDSLRLILEASDTILSEVAFQKALTDKNDHYLQLIKSMDKNEILPGVLPVLIQLAKNGIPIALGSASKNAKTILEAIELIDFFDFISDGNLVKKGKPHPETFLLCSEYFGLSPKDCIVFEDSMKGIQAANTGGFKSIGLGDTKVLSEADLVYNSFTEITLTQLVPLYNS